MGEGGDWGCNNPKLFHPSETDMDCDVIYFPCLSQCKTESVRGAGWPSVGSHCLEAEK